MRHIIPIFLFLSLVTWPAAGLASGHLAGNHPFSIDLDLDLSRHPTLARFSPDSPASQPVASGEGGSGGGANASNPSARDEELLLLSQQLPFKPPEPESSTRKILGWSAVGLAGASLIAITGLQIYAWGLSSSEPADLSEEQDINDKIDGANLGTWILGGVAGAAAIAGVFLLWPEHKTVARVACTPQFSGLVMEGVF